MTAIVLEDAREYIFPLFIVDSEDNGVYLESRQFVGTAFFVSSRGDAITAGHVLPDPSTLPPLKRLVAVVQRGDVAEVCWITHAACLPEWDLGLIHVNLEGTKYLLL